MVHDDHVGAARFPAGDLREAPGGRLASAPRARERVARDVQKKGRGRMDAHRGQFFQLARRRALDPVGQSRERVLVEARIGSGAKRDPALREPRVGAAAAEVGLTPLQRDDAKRKARRPERERHVTREELILKRLRVRADENWTRAAGPKQDRREEIRERFPDSRGGLDREETAPVKRIRPERGHLALPLPVLEPWLETLEARKGLF
jgi:hypothetical protein